MGSVKKLAISLPPELARAVKVAAEQDRTSVSGWLAEAAARRLRRRAALLALKNFEMEYGEIEERELEAVDRWLESGSG